MRFDGRIVLVTGAARGIGRAIALGFARHGASIAVNYVRSADKARAVCAEATAAFGVPAIHVQADIADAEQVARMVSAVEREFGHIDILVNNAGVNTHVPLLELDPATWSGMIGTNLTGTYLCCRAVVPGMIERRFGRIINLSSASGLRPRPGGAHYSASKAGIIGFNKVLALEIAPYGLTANVLGPGLTETDMPRARLSPGQMEVEGGRNPMGRNAQPEDIVGPALFLASEYAAFVTGQTLLVNGGTLMP